MNPTHQLGRRDRRQAHGALLALMAELAEDLVARQRAAQADARARPLPTATELPPCADKVAVLAARWAAGEDLWHKDDGRVGDNEGHRVWRRGQVLENLGRVRLQGAGNDERPALAASAGRSG